MQDTKAITNSYVAGLFDIGGCVKIEPPRKEGKSALLVWITSKNFKVIEALQAFGAYVGQKQGGQYRAKWKDKKAYVFLKAVSPYLIMRKDQANVGMEFWEEKTQSPTEETDMVYIVRLKLLKKVEEEGG